ncbi:hypothetical protein GWK47_054875 [Chionoecetes opilio]|uniref:Uncharacterized protein n=1 Tax=Chionoecetes opilio TaxID=41210 RepID=A0A8J4XZF9_CHIOP|nr:hypothetical protein GWK47_054875 [Chionoecetes opilio]
MDIKRADWGKFQASLDEWWVHLRAHPTTCTNRRGTSRQPFRGQPTQPFLSALRGPAPSRLGVLQRGRQGAQPPSPNPHRKLYNDSPTPSTCGCCRMCLSGPGRPSGLEWCASFNQTPPSALWRNVRTASGAAPTDRPPTHNPTEGGRDSSACSPRVAPAPKFLLAHATSSNSFDNTAQRVSGRGGEPYVADHLFTRQELSSARKKGRDTRCRTTA